jgi:poly(A) polymerase
MLGSSMTPADASSPPSGGPRLEVPPLALELGERFRTAGYQFYLVGGAVRELLMGHASRGEFDFATDAKPEVTLRILQGWAEAKYLQGIRFGTVGAKKGGFDLEITTFRKEMYPSDDRHPHVTFGDRIEEDLARRDFTVNAMAIRLPEGEFVDPYGGVRDLAAKRLDTPLDPEVSFGDDPLRMLRAARFVSSLEVVPTRRVVEAMRGMSDRLEIVSAERIRDELSGCCCRPSPRVGSS